MVVVGGGAWRLHTHSSASGLSGSVGGLRRQDCRPATHARTHTQGVIYCTQVRVGGRGRGGGGRRYGVLVGVTHVRLRERIGQCGGDLEKW